jgi:hypothetical protein
MDDRSDASANGESPLSPPSPNDEDGPAWYWVSATYKAVHLGVPRKRHLWERTVFLIRASSDAEAADVARQVAREKEHEYLAAGGDMVRWVLQEVEEIHELFESDIQQGTEVYWEFFERVDKAPDGGPHPGA